MAAALAACERIRSAKSALALSAKMARERVPAAKMHFTHGILMSFGQSDFLWDHLCLNVVNPRAGDKQPRLDVLC